MFSDVTLFKFRHKNPQPEQTGDNSCRGIHMQPHDFYVAKIVISGENGTRMLQLL